MLWIISMRSQAVSLKKPWISVPNKLRTIKIMEDKKKKTVIIRAKIKLGIKSVEK